MTDEEAASTPAPDASAASDAAARATAEDTGAHVAELTARVAELESQLAHEREAATDYMNRWQRAQADFANFKRRSQQDQQQIQRALAAEAARLILPALDSFERAFSSLPSSLRSLTWINGVALVEQQLAQALSLTGLQPIAAEPGHSFDPTKHEAIGEVESAEHPAGSVAVIVQRGYHIEGFVLRPALVQLAKAKAAESATAPAAESENPAESATTPSVGASGGRSDGRDTDAASPAESATAPPLSSQGEGAGGEDPEPGTS